MNPGSKVPDVNAHLYPSWFATEAGRLGQARNLLGGAIFDAAGALLHAVPSASEMSDDEGRVAVGNELLPSTFAAAVQEIAYLAARLAHRLHVERTADPEVITCQLHHDGFCAFHSMERRRPLWDGKSGTYQVSENHCLSLRRGAYEIAAFHPHITGVPTSGFDPLDPRHTTYQIASLNEAYAEEIEQHRLGWVEFVEQIRTCDPRFRDDPLGTFDRLELLTSSCFTDRRPG